MRNIILLALTALVIAVPAYCYELHLLNGMVVKGELTGFSDGRFFVKSDVGQMAIEAARLDYIIVEESDGKAAPADVPGYPLGPGEAVRVGTDAPPAPLASHSLYMPFPLNGWTLSRPSDRQFFPGVFKGNSK
ncbi:MAG: hypothetical protein HZC51_01380 [Nitrospirae bacterium]|nr:hypothetical protein [Nitrospirota bacterium]